jgi:hypothetical protein
MAKENPLKISNPLTPTIEFTLKKEVTKHTCVRCNSKKVENYSSVNGTGRYCVECNHYWPVGHFGGITQSERQKMADNDRAYRENILVAVSQDLSMPEQEFQQIEETIQRNEEFFYNRLHGEY